MWISLFLAEKPVIYKGDEGPKASSSRRKCLSRGFYKKCTKASIFIYYYFAMKDEKNGFGEQISNPARKPSDLARKIEMRLANNKYPKKIRSLYK